MNIMNNTFGIPKGGERQKKSTGNPAREN